MLSRNYVCVETQISPSRDLPILGGYRGVWGVRSDSGGTFVRIPPLSLPDPYVDYAYLEPGRFGNGELRKDLISLTTLCTEIEHRFRGGPADFAVINAAASVILSLDAHRDGAGWKPIEHTMLGVPYSPGDYVDLYWILEDIQAEYMSKFTPDTLSRVWYGITTSDAMAGRVSWK